MPESKVSEPVAGQRLLNNYLMKFSLNVGNQNPKGIALGKGITDKICQEIVDFKMLPIGESHGREATEKNKAQIQRIYGTALQEGKLGDLDEKTDLRTRAALRYDQTNLAVALVLGTDPLPYVNDLTDIYKSAGEGAARATLDLAVMKAVVAKDLMQKHNIQQSTTGRNDVG